MLVLRDPQWWLEHPEELAELLEKAVEYQSREPTYHGPIYWFGHDRAAMAADTPREVLEPGALEVREEMEQYATHPEQMRPKLEIAAALRRQQARGPEPRLRDLLDNAPPPDDRSRDSGRE